MIQYGRSENDYTTYYIKIILFVNIPEVYSPWRILAPLFAIQGVLFDEYCFDNIAVVL